MKGIQLVFNEFQRGNTIRQSANWTNRLALAQRHTYDCRSDRKQSNEGISDSKDDSVNGRTVREKAILCMCCAAA
jgi:hypothetical protein